MANTIRSSRYWVGVLYPENMVDGWQDKIGDIVQIPYAYCVHDKDVVLDKKSADYGKPDKVHVHIMLAFPNTTTYNHALNVFGLLNAPSKSAVNKCEAVVGVRSVYDYLIHNTDSAKKVGKHQYDPKERIEGNNFDIHFYEQISLSQKEEMAEELADIVEEHRFTNFMSLRKYVKYHMDESYKGILRSYCSYLDKLCMANKSLVNEERERERNQCERDSAHLYRDGSVVVDTDTGEVFVSEDEYESGSENADGDTSGESDE